MTSWNEYYDDFMQKIRQYAAKLPMTENQYMRLAAEGLQAAQRKTNIINGVKKITTTDGTMFSLRTANEGYDVLIITRLVDPYGAELISQSIPQSQDTQEMSTNRFNEVPHWMARGKVGTTVDEVSGVEHRIYDSLGADIRVFPALDIGAEITMDYIMEIHKYSQGSPQWSSFFTNFSTAFAAAPPLEWQQLDDAWQSYSVMEYLLEINSPNFQVWERKFETACQVAIDNKQQFYFGGTSPYTMTPYGF